MYKRQPELGAPLLPWDDTPLVLAEPVLVDAEVRGAVVTISPTDRSRARILGWWTLVALGGLVALGLALLAALPVVRWVLRPVRRLDDATGALLGAVVAGRPVEPVGIAAGPAELRQLGRSFDVMAANVAEVLAAQRAFIADASHQLRNPLTALRLRLGNLEGEVSPAATADQAAALAEAARLNQILDDLLTAARAEASTVEPVAVDIDPVVAQRVATWQVAARARGVDLVLAGEPGGRVLAPPRGVETVLDALLDNAVKFTPEPPPDPPLIEVRVARVDGRVRLSVRDHGPGLDEEELARATDRFWRSRAHQNVSGSGLGLAIVRRIAERVGGAVSLDRPEDGGLRVTVELPAA